jgi:hypothetical protein
MMTSPVIWQYRDSIREDWRNHHPATQILSLICHMTGEVITQLPRYCLYAVIWLRKSSSSYPDHFYARLAGWLFLLSYVSIDMIWVAGWWLLLSYYRIEIWSGSWMMTSHVIWQYRNMIGYWMMTSPVICHLATQIMSILTYDRRSHHPATRRLSLYWHMTGEVIIQLPNHVSILSYDRRSHHTATQILSPCCHMTVETWSVTGWWLLLSYVSIETVSGQLDDDFSCHMSE